MAFHCCASQNHRMVGVGRDLCGSSGPTPLPKQGHLEQAAQFVLTGFSDKVAQCVLTKLTKVHSLF